MRSIKRINGPLTFIIILLLLATSPAAISQDKSKKKEAPQGTPVLWQDPGDIASKDLFHGPGGEALKPDLSSVTFIKDEPGGYSKKYRVRDGAGKTWVVKIGKEAQPETVSTRLLWAVGYPTDITYLVPRVEIKGKGTFENVRFEARPEGMKRLDEWQWESNPFNGTKELQGLKILMVMLNNWDIKNANNRIIHVRNETAGRDELRYIVSDLGATFGKTGNWITHNRNAPKDYVRTNFVEKVEGANVRFDYHGKNSAILRDITVEQAKWIGGLLSQLTDQQIQDALRAANYGAEDAEALAGEIRARINELAALPGGPMAHR